MIPQEFLSYPLQMDTVKRKTMESLRTTFHIYICALHLSLIIFPSSTQNTTSEHLHTHSVQSALAKCGLVKLITCSSS